MQTVFDIMHSIITIDKNSLIKDAAKKMTKYNRGSVIITNKNENIGILTERDILRLVAKDIKVFDRKLTKYYSKIKITADVLTTLQDAAKLMRKNNIRRLPITKSGKIVGLVTANSIAKNLRFNFTERLTGVSPLDIEYQY